MTQQIDQLVVFKKMVKVIDSGRYSYVRKGDRLIRQALFANKNNRTKKGTFELNVDDVSFFQAVVVD